MILTFAGLDGSGKSTLARRAEQWLKERGISARLVDKWEILDANRLSECRFISTSLAEIQTCIAEMEGPARAMFLFWSISLTLEKALRSGEHKVFILDGYWMKHAAAEIVYGTPRPLITQLSEALPRSNAVIYLRSPISVAADRKGTFTPYECGRRGVSSIDGFLSHQAGVSAELEVIRQRAGDWREIDSSRPIEDVWSDVRQVLIDEVGQTVP